MTIAFIPCHYGKEYLAWAVRCAEQAVDETHIFYTAQPSFGFSSGATCPDREEELHAEAHRFAKKPIFWHRVEGVQMENQHRLLFWHKAKERGADVYVAVDADEIWDPESLKTAIAHVQATDQAGRYLARFAGLWRSFKWQVHDGFRPVRLYNMRKLPGPGTHLGKAEEYLDETTQPVPVLHFGYAIREELMRYKWTCHGHQHELRKGWVDDVFMSWTPERGNLHPVADNVWSLAQPTEPKILEKINELLHDHPYKDVELIR